MTYGTVSFYKSLLYCPPTFPPLEFITGIQLNIHPSIRQSVRPSIHLPLPSFPSKCSFNLSWHVFLTADWLHKEKPKKNLYGGWNPQSSIRIYVICFSFWTCILLSVIVARPPYTIWPRTSMCVNIACLFTFYS